MNRQAIGMMVVWIFVLIAGGIILVLFFFIADTQAQSAQAGLSLQALQQVDAILTTQQASDNTFATIPIPPEEIQFTCDYIDARDGQSAGITSEIRIGGIPQDAEYALMAARNMQADELLVFTYRAMLPFSIGNILFVSNSQEVLMLLGESQQQIEALVGTLPEPVQETTRTSRGGVDAQNYENVRVVYFGSEPEFTGAVTSAQDAVYIHVDSERIQDSGKIQFYRYDETGNFVPDGTRTYEYSGMPMLLAYIWMGDDDNAMCLTHKLSSRLTNLASVQMRRLALLREEAFQRAQESGTEDTCVNRYSTVQIENLREQAEIPPPGNTFGELSEAVRLVRLQNEELLRGDRCATIY